MFSPSRVLLLGVLLCHVGCADPGSQQASGPLKASAATLVFPATYVGYPSASITWTLTNTASTATPFNGVALTGAAPSDYSQTTNCAASLATQASCHVWIVFTPTAAGTRTATVTVNGTVTQAQVTGTGAANPPATFGSALNGTTVFMGASIVQYWPLPMNNKGIAGQTTPQMLARFQSDVLGHGYQRVVILGGSNDILQSLPNTVSELTSNIQAMGQMASAAGMEVVLSQLPPSTQVPTNGVPYNTTVVQVNAALKQLALQNNWLVLDDYSILLPYPQDQPDGLHPNAAGYALMEQQLAGVVAR